MNTARRLARVQLYLIRRRRGQLLLRLELAGEAGVAVTVPRGWAVRW